MPSLQFKSVLFLGLFLSAGALGILFHRPLISYLKSKKTSSSDEPKEKERKFSDLSPDDNAEEEQLTAPLLDDPQVSDVANEVKDEAENPKPNALKVPLSLQTTLEIPSDVLLDFDLPILMLDTKQVEEDLALLETGDVIHLTPISNDDPTPVVEEADPVAWNMMEEASVVHPCSPSEPFSSPSSTSSSLLPTTLALALEPVPFTKNNGDDMNDLFSIDLSSRRESEDTVKAEPTVQATLHSPTDTIEVSRASALSPSNSSFKVPMDDDVFFSEAESPVSNDEPTSLPFGLTPQVALYTSDQPMPFTTSEVTFLSDSIAPSLSSFSLHTDAVNASFESKKANTLNLDAPAFIPSALNLPPLEMRDGEEEAEVANGHVQPLELEPKFARCHFWPDCKFGTTCVYWHPIHLCPNEKLTGFEPLDCVYGSRCYFYHTHELRQLESNGVKYPTFERSKGLEPPNYSFLVTSSPSYEADDDSDNDATSSSSDDFASSSPTVRSSDDGTFHSSDPTNPSDTYNDMSMDDEDEEDVMEDASSSPLSSPSSSPLLASSPSSSSSLPDLSGYPHDRANAPPFPLREATSPFSTRDHGVVAPSDSDVVLDSLSLLPRSRSQLNVNAAPFKPQCL